MNKPHVKSSIIIRVKPSIFFIFLFLYSYICYHHNFNISLILVFLSLWLYFFLFSLSYIYFYFIELKYISKTKMLTSWSSVVVFYGWATNIIIRTNQCPLLVFQIDLALYIKLIFFFLFLNLVDLICNIFNKTYYMKICFSILFKIKILLKKSMRHFYTSHQLNKSLHLNILNACSQ